MCALAAFAPALLAATFCVSSTIALDSALEHFVNDNEDTTIRLRQGGYFIQPSTNQQSADLTIIGGYTDANCQFRSLDPSLTVLRSNGSDTIELHAKNLNLESLTIRDVSRSVYFVARGTTFSNGRMTIGRVRFEGPATAGNVLVGEEVFISQVLVQHSGSTSTTDFGTCALAILGPADDDDQVVVQHSTIVDSPNKGLCVNPRIGTENREYTLYIDNNILYGSRLDLEIGNTSRWVVRNNTYAGFATEIGASVPGASGNNLTTNPLFVNPGAGNYRLQPASPAVNSGRNPPQGGLPQFDITGSARWTGTAPDRGVYESTFDNAQELVVTSTGDASTTGTLRWAIAQANASPGYSVIRFNIPGACPRVIVLNENLPAIVTPVGIDGYSQPGSHPNTLAGGGAGPTTDAQICVLVTSTGVPWGLRVPQGSANGQLGVSGISIGGFTQAAISIEDGNGSSIVGNDIRAPQPIGIFVGGGATGTQIGGADPWQTNVVRSDAGYGIALNPPSSGARVENNLIGIEADGNAVTSGNAIGIGISAADNTIVGNAIAGSSSLGVQITGSRNLVRGNVLGRKVGFVACPFPPCNADLANGSHGVLIQGDATGNAIDGNTIANSGGHGICATSGQQNLFLGNRIWNSGQLGIDLGDNGNDAANNDTLPGEAAKPNRGINPPIQGNARGGARNGIVTGLMQTTNGRYLMQAYMSNDCAHGGQGQWFVGYAVVDIANATSSANGNVLFEIPIRSVNPQPTLPGKFITIAATQISAAGYGHSSEMSNCTTYTDDTIFKNGFD